MAAPPRPRIQPGQFRAKHDFGEFYQYVTLNADAPCDGINTLSHVVGGRQLSDDAYRLLYGSRCRVAAR